MIDRLIELLFVAELNFYFLYLMVYRGEIFFFQFTFRKVGVVNSRKIKLNRVNNSILNTFDLNKSKYIFDSTWVIYRAKCVQFGG